MDRNITHPITYNEEGDILVGTRITTMLQYLKHATKYGSEGIFICAKHDLKLNELISLMETIVEQGGSGWPKGDPLTTTAVLHLKRLRVTNRGIAKRMGLPETFVQATISDSKLENDENGAPKVIPLVDDVHPSGTA